MARLESRTPRSTVATSAVATASVGRRARRTVVWLGGDHDVSTTTMVNAAAGRATRLDKADVVVDLSEVTFMGAATLGILLRTRRTLQAQGRVLELRAPSPAAQRLIEVFRLERLLEAIPLVSAAAQPFGAAGALRSGVEVPVRGRLVVDSEARPDDHAAPPIGVDDSRRRVDR